MRRLRAIDGIASLQSRWQGIDAPAAATNLRQDTSKSNGDQGLPVPRAAAREGRHVSWQENPPTPGILSDGHIGAIQEVIQ
jgi:hypothetical protein